MPNTELTTAKLIILYILRKVPGISPNELMSQSIDSLYMDYFLYTQAKNELIDSHLMTQSVRKGQRVTTASGKPEESCDITPEGQVVLTRLLPSIPSGALAYLTAEAEKKTKKDSIKNAISADYAPDADGAYEVRLSLTEGSKKIIDIRLHAPNQSTAKKMCRQWKDSTADIYSQIILQLSSSDNQD